MNLSPGLASALVAALFCASASAQLKLPKGQQPDLPARAVPAVPATVPAASAPAAVPASASSAADEAADKEAAGKLAAQGWLFLLDRGDWGRSWETSASMFRSMVPLAAWMDGIPKVRATMGALLERIPTQSVYKTTLEGRPPGDYVTVVFASKFQNRQVEETVTMVREADGKWRATGYSTR